MAEAPRKAIFLIKKKKEIRLSCQEPFAFILPQLCLEP